MCTPIAATLPASVCAPVRPLTCGTPRHRKSRSARIRTSSRLRHVAKDVFAIRTQIDDWISDDLAGAVIGDFSSAIRFKDRHVAFLQNLTRTRRFRCSAERRPQGQGVRMLEQKQCVGCAPVRTARSVCFESPALPRIRRGLIVRLEELVA